MKQIVETIEIRNDANEYAGKFEINLSEKRKEYGWRLKAANNEVISRSNGFNTLQTARDNIEINRRLFGLVKPA